MALSQWAERSNGVKRSITGGPSLRACPRLPLAKYRIASATSAISTSEPPYGISQLLRTWRQASPAVVKREPGYCTMGWIRLPASGACDTGRLL